LNDGTHVYLLLYVHDILITTKDINVIQDLRNKLKFKFKMKDLGLAGKILGMEIQHDQSTGKLFLNQCKYVEKILSRFGMTSSKAIMTPYGRNLRLSSVMSPQT
jgi:hypothetical protein